MKPEKSHKLKLYAWPRIIFGVFLIAFGVIGHLVPLLPGSFFIAAGLLLLAESFPAVKKFMVKLETRYPSFGVLVKKLQNKDGSLRIGKVVIIGLIIAGIFITAAYYFFR